MDDGSPAGPAGLRFSGAKAHPALAGVRILGPQSPRWIRRRGTGTDHDGFFAGAAQEESMRTALMTLVFAAGIGFGLSGSAAAVPAGGVALGDIAAAMAGVQDAQYSE